MSITGPEILIKLILHLQVVLLLRDTHGKRKATAWQFETLPRGRRGTTSPTADEHTGVHSILQHGVKGEALRC